MICELYLFANLSFIIVNLACVTRATECMLLSELPVVLFPDLTVLHNPHVQVVEVPSKTKERSIHIVPLPDRGAASSGKCHCCFVAARLHGRQQAERSAAIDDILDYHYLM